MKIRKKLFVQFNFCPGTFSKVKTNSADDYYFGVILTVSVRVHRCRK